jgi:hypothetical protein
MPGWAIKVGLLSFLSQENNMVAKKLSSKNFLFLVVIIA